MAATALAAARAAGRYLRGALASPHGVTYKGAIDLVTEADLAAERLIVETIRAAFPDDDIVTEETASVLRGARRRWIVDPLDGTTNFAHGYPIYAVSIGVVEDGVTTLGVVALPSLAEVFLARRGGGAVLNGAPIRVSDVSELGRAFLVSGFPYDVRESGTNLPEWARFVVRAQAVRRDGAAAANLAYVACGRFDGFWEAKLHPWDVAAGILLVEEAGGRVTDWHGRTDDVTSGAAIVATNGRVHAAMLETLAPS